MQEMLDIKNIEKLTEMLRLVESLNENTEWVNSLPANRHMASLVVANYIYNETDPEAILKLLKGSLYDLVKEVYVDYVNDFDDEESKAEYLQIFS